MSNNQETKAKVGFLKKLDDYFGITAKGSTFRTEIIGGLTTFFAMCYILFVNPSAMVGDGNPTLLLAIFISTAIGAIVGTALMALLAKVPFAQAPGMGLNSFFFVAFMLTGFGAAAASTPEAYQAGLSIVFISGILFLIVSVTGIRKVIFEALPQSLKKAIPAGIGLFIAYIAFQNAGIITANPFVQVQFVDLTQDWYTICAPIAALLGFFLIGTLSKTKLRGGAVIIGIIVTAGIYYLFNIGNPSAYSAFTGGLSNPADAFKAFGELSLGAAFKGFKYWEVGTILSAIMLVITFCLIDMFDTMGTLQGTCAEAGMLDKNGNPIRLQQALMSDAIATVVGAVAGTSTVTTYVESASGVSAGARTGFSSLVVTLLFIIAMFLSPLAAIIPAAATAPALMFVGVLMLKNFKEVDFSDMTSAIPAFITLIMMPLTYSISNGIALGMISYIILRLASIRSLDDVKDFFKKDTVILVLAILFALRFFLVAM